MLITDSETYKNMPLRHFLNLIGDMEEHELLTLKTILDDSLDTINDQLSRAKAELQTAGTHSDPNWYWSAVRAKKHIGRKSQAIQAEFKRRKTVKRVRLEKAFMDSAKLLLNGDTFQMLLDAANDTLVLEK